MLFVFKRGNCSVWTFERGARGIVSVARSIVLLKIIESFT